MKWHLGVLSLIIIASILLKALLFSATPYFTPDSYFTLRQAVHIQQEYLPFHQDTNTINQQGIFVVPALAYVYALLSHPSIEVGHLLLMSISTLASCIMFFLIARTQTQSTTIQVLSTAFFASIPLVYTTLTYSIHSAHLMIPLLLFLTYLSLLVRKQKIHPLLGLLLALLTILIHPITMIWIIGYLVFLLLCWVERLNTAKQEREFIAIISITAVVWTSIILGRLLVVHGIQILWKNIPGAHQALQITSVIDHITSIGITPLALTTFAIFLYSRGTRNKDLLLFISMMGTFLFLTLATFSSTGIALLYFSVFMSCTLPYAIQITRDYIGQTKFIKLNSYLVPILVLLLLVSSVLPMMTTSLQKAESIDTALLEKLKHEFPANTHLIISPQLANQAIFYTNATVILHDHFLLNTQAQADVNLLGLLFSSQLNADKLTFQNKYNLNRPLVYLHNSSIEIYKPAYETFVNNTCFSPTQINNLYQIECSLVVS